MADARPPALLDSDYEAICAAVMETEKGRWFLAEYARRNRNSDTGAVLEAVGRLEGLLKRERRPDADRIRLDVAEMKDAIDRTKMEIAAIRKDGDGSRFDSATNELDAIIVQTERATQSILTAAEKLHEISFTMREGGIEGEICDAIEQLVMGIYEHCSFQDLTGQRTQKVVHVLRFLESRINAMMGIWGLEAADVAAAPVMPTRPDDQRPDADLLHGPAALGHGNEQSDIDALMTVGSEQSDQSDIDGLFGGPAGDVVAGDDDTVAGEALSVAAADAAVAGDPVAGPSDLPAAADPVPDAAPGDASLAAAGLVPADDALSAEELAEAGLAIEEAIAALKSLAASDEAAGSDDALAALPRPQRQALFS